MVRIRYWYGKRGRPADLKGRISNVVVALGRSDVTGVLLLLLLFNVLSLHRCGARYFNL